MGFDVTIHAVSESDLQRYVFDVVRDPALARSRARELTTDEAKLAWLFRMYEAFPEWKEDISDMSSTFGIACGVVAGFRSLFWYVRNEAISWIPGVDELMIPLAALAPDVFNIETQNLPKKLLSNESASGIILASNIPFLRSIITQFGNMSDSNKISDITEVGPVICDYASNNKLAIFEASDIVIPVANICYPLQSNMRASFLGKVNP